MYTKRSFGVSPRTIGGLLEDMFENGVNRFNEEYSAVTTPVNILDTDKSYELNVVAPGLKKEEFKVAVDRNILTISYEHKQENKDEQPEGKWLRSEYKTRSFKRSFTLNDKVDATKINAKYTDGILNITLPKKEVSEQTAQEIVVG